MAKDPAVLFYTSDFLTGVTFFKDEQIGQYIKLLCQQHQLGHLPENHMINVCGSKDNPVMKKFIVDDDGLYFNERMDEEIEKRVTYCNSRSHKGLAGRRVKSYENHTEIVCESIGNRTDNGNENDNSIDNIRVPHREIIEAYHENCPLLPRIQKLKRNGKEVYNWDGKDADALKTRWLEDENRQTLDWWVKFFKYVSDCPWLIGDNPKNWMADLRWIVKKGNFNKVIQGNYQTKGAA